MDRDEAVKTYRMKYYDKMKLQKRCTRCGNKLRKDERGTRCDECREKHNKLMLMNKRNKQ